MMKNTFLAAALGLFAAAPVLAQSGHSQHGHEAVAPAAALSDATVKKVDKVGGKVTLAHGPLENVGMPAMTMAFPVKSGVSLDKLKAGDKVRFRAEPVNGTLTVVALELAR